MSRFAWTKLDILKMFTCVFIEAVILIIWHIREETNKQTSGEKISFGSVAFVMINFSCIKDVKSCIYTT